VTTAGAEGRIGGSNANQSDSHRAVKLTYPVSCGVRTFFLSSASDFAISLASLLDLDGDPVRSPDDVAPESASSWR
jgi:hypothetical protein